MSTPEEQLAALKKVLKECYFKVEQGNLDTWVVIDGHGWFDSLDGRVLAEIRAELQENA